MFLPIAILLLLMSNVTISYASDQSALTDQTNQYPFRHLTTDEGLSNNEVKNLVFDNKGILWIETQEGWNTWDGRKVETAKEGVALPSVKKPSDKTIAQWQHINIPKVNGAPTNFITDVKNDRKGLQWIATDHQGVFIYNKNSGEYTNLVFSQSQPTSIAENHVSCIAVSRNGVVALGHLKKGVSIYDPSFPRFTHFKSNTWRNVSAVAETHEGQLWIGTDGFGLINVTSRKHFDITGNIVVCMMVDHNGFLWVGSYKQGLFKLKDGKTVKRYTKGNSKLSDNSVYSITEDRFGNIWIGTLWGHIQKFTPSTGKWQDFTSKSPDQSIAIDFWYDGHDMMCCGTLGGLRIIDIRNGKTSLLTSNYHGKPFLKNNILSLMRDNRGLLWLCHDKGVTVWNTRTDSLYYLSKVNGLCDDVTRAVCQDGKGRMWIATSNGCSVITVNQNGNGITFSINNLTTKEGLLDNNLSRHSTIRLHDGNILMGSYEGYSFVNLTDKSSPIETAKPYEIDEDKTFWTSWQAWLICAGIILLIIFAYFWQRRTKRTAMQIAINKANEFLESKNKEESGVSKANNSEEPLSGTGVKLTTVDKQLIEKATKVVEDNINNDITVEKLAEEVGLTRGHLYKRLMAITGKSPVEFIRSIRMKFACQLLKESGMQVSEVAYAVGYSSPKIFSRNFKAEFGMTPTEFKSREEN